MTITSLGSYTGPIRGTTVQRATANVQAFCKELTARNLRPTTCERSPQLDDNEGRYGFLIGVNGRDPHEVLMPGAFLRYVRPASRARGGETILHRLYIDDHPWTWSKAFAQFRAARKH